MKFGCTSCGACCRNVVTKLPGWPLRASGDACRYLAEDNKTCTIYETRPYFCRVDVMRPAGMSEAEWHNRNAKACNQLQVEYRMGLHLRVAEVEG